MKFYTKNFIAAREYNSMTQEELAKRIGVSRQAVQQWEDGTSRPRPANVYAAAKALGCSAVDISDLKPEDWLAKKPDILLNDPFIEIILEKWNKLTDEQKGRIAGIVCGMTGNAPAPVSDAPHCTTCGAELPADWKVGEKNACPNCGQHIILTPHNNHE